MTPAEPKAAAISPAAGSHLPGQANVSIPDHDLLSCVGRGGYGEVWLGRSLTGTYRGIKIVFRKSFERERPFQREFEGIQRFEPISRTHPGLVSILHVGRNLADGYFYYVMEVADDVVLGPEIVPASYAPKTVREVLKQGAIPLDDCVRIGLSLTDALRHLHQHGLIHRDVKPANIIFVNGAPKLADIGLVTGIGEGATFVGTAGYIPPEGPGSPAADLFSLGKVLYEIATGKDREEFPELPTSLLELARGPQLMQLNEVILQACEQDPRRRFQSAQAMHAALAELWGKGDWSFPAGAGASRTPRTKAPKALRVVLLSPLTGERDSKLASALAGELASQGCSVHLDPGQNLSLEWGRDLEKQIREADRIVVLLSAESVRSEMLAYEVELARQASQQEGHRPRVVAVRVGWQDPLPRHFQLALAGGVESLWNEPADTARLVGEITQRP